MDHSDGSGARPTRRAVLATGIKLAYAAPVVAATLHLAGPGARAAGGCACIPAEEGFVFDAAPPLDDQSNPARLAPACCSCGHCVFLGVPDAAYDPVGNRCVSATGQVAPNGCYPLCTDVCPPISV